MANTLIHDIAHHAKDKAEIVYALSVLFATELNPIGWQSKRKTKGNNSWQIYLKQDNKPTKIWYFTGYNKGFIIARNAYFWNHSSQKIKIATRIDAVRFTDKVIRES